MMKPAACKRNAMRDVNGEGGHANHNGKGNVENNIKGKANTCCPRSPTAWEDTKSGCVKASVPQYLPSSPCLRVPGKTPAIYFLFVLIRLSFPYFCHFRVFAFPLAEALVANYHRGVLPQSEEEKQEPTLFLSEISYTWKAPSCWVCFRKSVADFLLFTWQVTSV